MDKGGIDQRKDQGDHERCHQRHAALGAVWLWGRSVYSSLISRQRRRHRSHSLDFANDQRAWLTRMFEAASGSTSAQPVEKRPLGHVAVPAGGNRGEPPLG